MQWLQSKKRFQDVAKYDEESGEFEILDRNSPDCPKMLDGSFEILAGIFVALFKADLKLFIGIGDKTFQLDDDLVINVKGGACDRLLIIEKDNAVLVTVEYSIQSRGTTIGDTTAFIDDEDSDYGLFLCNISKDESRQRVLLGLD
ncbi:hypothetical protein [Gayadomonas joobiniege]|uniref:hypothetical protein n=1 Tax=Gayadomonas joobiniege TaxID=1234606 RepID=UPI00035EDB3A|nr:hypothetical protein [Gayadomonas joobiniege]